MSGSTLLDVSWSQALLEALPPPPSYASCYAFSGAALHLLICHEFAKASWC